MPENHTPKLSQHFFHAEAHALSGKLNKPFEADIKKQAFVKLVGESQNILVEPDEAKKLLERKAQENYFSQHAKNFRLESIISYSAAHTQVSGHRSKKDPDAFVTTATSSVEDLNVLNVVTADRVVAQISVTYRKNQYSPDVTFLGTHFENLRIARHKTLPALNLGLVGASPKKEKGDKKDKYYLPDGTTLMGSLKKHYYELQSGFEAFLSRIEAKHAEQLRGDDSWPSQRYYSSSDFDYEALRADAAAAAAKDKESKEPISNSAKWKGVTCSLVEHVDIEDIVIPVRPKDPKEPPPDPIVYHPPAHCLGHVIHVPDFGTIFLAELKVNHNSFHLAMIRLELGCIADGSASFAACEVNGKGGGG